MNRYHYLDAYGNTSEALPLEALREMNLAPTTKVLPEGNEQWILLGEVLRGGPVVIPAPPLPPPPLATPPPPTNPPPVSASPSSLSRSQPPSNASKFYPTFFLGVFLGVFGAHRFYVRKIGTGVLQLVTFGGCGIWWLVDMTMILIGKFKDKSGTPIPNIAPKLSWSVFAVVVIIGLVSGGGGSATAKGDGRGGMPSKARMTMADARASSSEAKQWAKLRIEASTKAKVVQIDSWGWDEDHKCHVFGGLIDSPRSDEYMKFDIRVGLDESGEWKVVHIDINR